MIRSILITKSKNDKGVLADFCKSKNIQLLYHSFLTFSKIELIEIPKTEVLFFSSKRAVDYFLEQASISPETQIACIGEATKNQLELLGYNVDYVGQQAGNPELVSKHFASWLGDKSCVILLAKESKKSIIKHLNPTKINCCVVYETLIHSQKLDQQFDVVIFTSPSNAEGFLKENKITEFTKVLAWGETTKKYLVEQNINVTYTLANAHEAEVVSLISTH